MLYGARMEADLSRLAKRHRRAGAPAGKAGRCRARWRDGQGGHAAA
ncbi:hypothetical protein LP419_15605 [Massilia sp. H-1]|nr:hypothetical protein LP419_15605 [Massilia sp. H-1]